MARGRAEAEWERTALVCAVLVNANPFREGEPVEPSAFNPYAADAAPADDGPPLEVIPLSMLKDDFVRNGWK